MPKQPQTISFELAKKFSKFNLNFEPYFWYDKNKKLTNERIIEGTWKPFEKQFKIDGGGFDFHFYETVFNIDDGKGNLIKAFEFEPKYYGDAIPGIPRSIYWYRAAPNKEDEEKELRNNYKPAYQLHEILEMLPKEIPSAYSHPFNIEFLSIYNADNKYCFGYNKHYTSPTYKNKNPAEAAGNLLLWCIENGYVKV